jgi:DNA-binding protein
MASKQDDRVMLAAKILLLMEQSSRKKSVTEAMRDAGFHECEIKCKTRAKEAAVRRTYNEMKKKSLAIDVSIQEVNINSESIVSLLSETSSKETASTTASSALKTKMKKTLPGLKIVRQTSYQVNAMAHNALMMKQLRNNAIKEATVAWKEASELKVKGEQHRTKKEIIEMINSKPIYKENNVPTPQRLSWQNSSSGI